MRGTKDEHRILAVHPNHRGFGYGVFEGPKLLMDWGVRNIRGPKDTGCVEAVNKLIERYAPEVLVMEDLTSANCRRGARVKLLIPALARKSAQQNVRVQVLSRAEVIDRFATSGASTKYEIARAIAQLFPELADRLPPERKAWMSEDYRMAIFDAAALAVVYFHAKPAREHIEADQSETLTVE